MATFGLKHTDGTFIYFSHPCFAWVGSISQDNARRHTVQLPYIKSLAERTGDYYFQALGAESRDDYEVILKAYNQMDWGKDGVVLSIVDGTNHDAHPNFTGAHFKVHVPVDLIGWKHFRYLKMTAKILSYSNPVSKAFIDLLKEGATFGEASFVAAVCPGYGYNYPYPRMGESKEELLAYLRDGTMTEYGDKEKAIRVNSFDPFSNSNFGASAPDHPLVFDNYGRKGRQITLGDSLDPLECLQVLRKFAEGL